MALAALPAHSVRVARRSRPSIRHAVRLGVRPYLVWPLLLALCPVGVNALTLRALTLEELVSHSRTIFVGRCVTVRKVESAWGGLPATETEFSISKLMKSDRGMSSSRASAQSGAGERIRVRQIGAGVGPGLGARFRVGQEVLLFLYGESVTGLTSPVGMAQGVFTIVRAAPGSDADLAIRDAGPPRTTSIAALAQRAAGAGGETGASSQAVELDSLLAAVRRLVDESR